MIYLYIIQFINYIKCIYFLFLYIHYIKNYSINFNCIKLIDITNPYIQFIKYINYDYFDSSIININKYNILYYLFNKLYTAYKI